ncbi:trypsin-like peptidase domain-containing protein [Ancylobacter sp. TS-1]|uniref:trypsin-like peptidase domain-containing protein n=1 Tax=Ancylobacter sp. TS-1 TaxID=1850374 RepID=UPI001265BD0C|nr:trypsin-like peptidase domain-containing protein [Ancylobacter sp. TS-1]QFR33525.1 hypothetical protein GBB76_10560 [Ancylobacter sp. TS-1]
MRSWCVLKIGRAVSALSLAFLAFCTLAVPASAQESKNVAVRGLPPSAVMIDEDNRLSRADFARASGLPLATVAARFGATGLVRCGSAVGTGQLVGANNVLVTAAHVLFAPGGQPRGEGAGCTFQIEAGGRRQVVPIDVDGVVCGAREPYAEPAVKDWAVVPLAGAVVGATPYKLAKPMPVPSDIVLAAARSGGVESFSLQRCRARQVTAATPSGLREVAVDCDAEGGVSGAALLTPGGAFLGVYVGFRSAHPGAAGPFSMSHYNFGVTAEGSLRQAIAEVVGRNRSASVGP